MSKSDRKNLMDLEPPPTEPDPVVQSIAAPEAGAHLRRSRKRKRDWERGHPVLRCWIPVHVREIARATHAAIIGLAENLSGKEDEEYFTTTGEVARVLLEFSWQDIERGVLRLEPYPNPHGRKMRLAWEEVGEGWRYAKRIPRSGGGKKQGKGSMWLGYRMLPEEVNLWRDRIQRLAKQHDLTPGEVLVRLLNHGLEAYQSGRLVLRAVPVVKEWRISGQSSRKNGW